jgi:hypothetical protein
MAIKKRNKGKRHKNSKQGAIYTSLGTGKRNKNSKRCTHYDEHGGQCVRRINVHRGERPICEFHLHRHRQGSKTRAIIQHCQGNKFLSGMGGIP